MNIKIQRYKTNNYIGVCLILSNIEKEIMIDCLKILRTFIISTVFKITYLFTNQYSI